LRFLPKIGEIVVKLLNNALSPDTNALGVIDACSLGCVQFVANQVARFRLRFLLQEFDLTPGDTIIGRSPDCHITIDDPLLSRQHVKISVVGDSAIMQDMGSRNGSRLNGKVIADAQPLTDGDRIRLGTQELVFFRVHIDQRISKATGAMRLCPHCTTPFPEGPTACPHCGKSVKHTDEDTMSGPSGTPVRNVWILQMLNDMLDRTLRAGRVEESQKFLFRAAEEIENRIVSTELDTIQFARVSELALQYSLQRTDPRWTLWVLDVHRRSLRPPSAPIVDALFALVDLEGVPTAIKEYLEVCKGSGIFDDQCTRLARVSNTAPL
jgi:Inner membrane component of T3SS, cytoplasmic domain